MSGVDFSTSAHGPLFDGTAPGIASRMIADITEHLTNTGHAMVYSFNMEFKSHPTWQWETQLTAVTDGQNHGIIEDFVPYTAWLEGVSSRNLTSRFKGYHMWQKSALWLQQAAAGIGNAVVSWWLPYLGGNESPYPMPPGSRYAGGRAVSDSAPWIPWEHSRYDPNG